jgi:hypothetical protein
MTDVATVVDRYLDMWNETDPARRLEHIDAAWVPAARYIDPQLEAEGHGGLGEMVAGVQAHFPGHRFRRTTGIDQHHDRVRFGWELVAPDGSVTVAGIDVGELDGDGRLRSITGFFGEIPAADAA